MNFLNMDLKKFLVLVVLVAVPLLSINMQRNNGDRPWYTVPFSIVTGLTQNAYSTFSTGVRGTASLYLDLINIKKNNRILTKENSELRAQLGEMTELKLENQRLSRLLDFRSKTKMDLLAAKVIGRDILPDHASITIDRGSHHGLKKGLAAITVGGVVGYVIDVDLFSSHILLITDRYSVIDAIVQRSRARGITEGSTDDAVNIRFKYLQRGDDVQVGDLVVTSGLDDNFPKGFPVGTVTKVKKDQYGMSQDVKLKPSINPFSLEELFLVLKTNQENLEPEVKPDAQSEKENPPPAKESTGA